MEDVKLAKLFACIDCLVYLCDSM